MMVVMVVLHTLIMMINENTGKKTQFLFIVLTIVKLWLEKQDETV